MVNAILVFAGLLVSGAALAQSADVGLVNMVSGNVTYSPSAATAAKAVQAFMKVRDGDRIDLAAGGEVRVLFFDAKRQERWLGPASFRAGKGGAVPLTGKPTSTTDLPAAAPQRLARVPDLVQFAKLGGIQVRGKITPAQKVSLEQQAAVTEARATYDKMRKDSAPDDIAPELFLYSALHEYLLYDDMKPLVEEMLRKQPGNPDLNAFAEWLRTRASR